MPGVEGAAWHQGGRTDSIRQSGIMDCRAGWAGPAETVFLAKVAELVDALVLGTSGATRESSSLSFRTIGHLRWSFNNSLICMKFFEV